MTILPAGSRAQPPDFDPLARIYRWMEWLSFGPWLWRCRTTFLNRLKHGERALLIGDGDGRFATSVLRMNRTVLIDAVDASQAMLDELTRRAGPDAPRVKAHQADARLWQPTGGTAYDLVATQFFLDCLTTKEVRQLVETLRPSLAPGAIWIVSEFAVPNGHYRRIAANAIISGLYAAFGLLTALTVRKLPDHQSALLDSGFELREQRDFLGGLLVSQLWAYRP